MKTAETSQAGRLLVTYHTTTPAHSTDRDLLSADCISMVQAQAMSACSATATTAQ